MSFWGKKCEKGEKKKEENVKEGEKSLKIKREI
jgi:hypothetical protein